MCTLGGSSSFSPGSEDAGDVIFDLTVDSVVLEERNGLSPEETVCEIFDLTEAHFFSFSIVSTIV